MEHGHKGSSHKLLDEERGEGDDIDYEGGGVYENPGVAGGGSVLAPMRDSTTLSPSLRFAPSPEISLARTVMVATRALNRLCSVLTVRSLRNSLALTVVQTTSRVGCRG